MKTFNCVSLPADSKSKSYFCCLFIAISCITGAYFIGSAVKDYKNRLSHWELTDSTPMTRSNMTQSNPSVNQCSPSRSEALPEGIVAKTSNLEMRPLWGSVVNNKNSEPPMNLLAIAVGIKQKEIVNQIVQKFLSSNFVVMLFHYDGIVDEWRDLAWSNCAIHVSAVNQTKWWFAKRFLHPDIVAEYNYIFLWDEDIGVENFHPGRPCFGVFSPRNTPRKPMLWGFEIGRFFSGLGEILLSTHRLGFVRYLSIVKEEGLEISQPALDTAKSEVYHQITARVRDSRVHRRIYKLRGKGKCDEHSTAPRCTGWVEIMAPVFSRAAWRCVWYMIQNDLIHGWGLDLQLGYCAQGDRTKNVGVVDSEFIAHLGLPTLGVFDGDEESSKLLKVNYRSAVRRQSFKEMQIFKKRWDDAVKEDKCWVDPYKNSNGSS